MNKKHLMFAAFCAAAVSSSAQLISFNVLDSDIRVGETFDIQVLLDKSVVAPDAELLSFGFDVFNSATVAYLSTLVGPPFSDDSAVIPYDVGGSAFPGVTDPSFTIATLTFRALAETSGSVSIFGPVDVFGGLKYSTFDPTITAGLPFINEDFPIDATVRFDIGPGDLIPEPSMIGLLGFGVVIALLSGRRRR